MHYIFNDETQKNSYGFKIKTAGIDLSTRFIKNPICLNNHLNDTKNVLGKWKDIKQSNGLLTGIPDFDTEDREGKEVVRKINNGTIVSVSMGIFFDPQDMILEAGELCLNKCELYEVSFVAVPSNANSVTLYNKNDGKEFTSSQIHELTFKVNQQQVNMKNMNLITQHLKLSDNASEQDILKAIDGLIDQKTAELKAEKAELKANYDALVAEKTAELKANYDSELELAVKDGRIEEATKEAINQVSLTAGYEKGLALLKTLPKYTPIADKINLSASALSNYDQMTWEELDKGNHLVNLKVENPAYFEERFKKQFGKKTNQS